MESLKKAPLVIVGTVAGIVAARRLQKRRSKNAEEKAQAAPETPSEHVKAAIEHSRQAAKKTKESPPRITE